MKKISSNIRHCCVHLANIDNYIVDKLLECINLIKVHNVIIVTAFYYCLGMIINNYKPFPKFGVFHSLFTGIFMMAFFSVRYFEKQMKEIHRLMAGDNTLQPINDKIYRLRHSSLNLVIPPLAGAFFGVLALILVNVKIDTPSAGYLIMTYVLCVLVSFLGYLQYVYLFVYIWRLSRNTKKITLYNKDYPSNTKWVIMITKLYSNYRNIFFVLGAAYVFGVIYFVLCGDYRVLEKMATSSWYGIFLILFWGSVFIAIVIFFPTSSIIEYFNNATSKRKTTGGRDDDEGK